MEYCFQLLPHTNIQYQDALASLGKVELACMLEALDIHAAIKTISLGGASFLSLACDELPVEVLRRLSAHSAQLLVCQRREDWLRPMDVRASPYLTRDVAEVLKYKGKTSTAFTRMMLNCAHAASDFFLDDRPLTVLDPICGKATTCFCALERGWNALGVDVDAAALDEVDRYFAKHLQLHHVKHERKQRSMTVGGRGVPETTYTFADTREHYQQKDTRFLRLFLSDTAACDRLLAKAPADLLVGDLPYGIQHAPVDGHKPEPFTQLLRRSLPAWRRSLKDGGALALSFNTYTLPRETLLRLLEEASFVPLDSGPYHSFAHFVQQAVNRDAVVARKT